MKEIDIYLIGIEDCIIKQDDFEYLPGVASDINKISDFVTSKNMFSNIKTEINLNQDEFLKMVNNIELSNSDVVILYFSGHGCILNGEHHLVLHDDFFLTKDLLDKSRFNGKHVVLILDCCYSGQIIVDYDFNLFFDSEEATTSKTIFSASEYITNENSSGGYFTEDLLTVIQNCKNNMNGSLNIDAIFFELMEISKNSKKNYHVYTNNFFTIDLNCINPKIFSTNKYPEIAFQEIGEIFKIDNKIQDGVKIYTVYVRLYEENYSTKTIYYSTRNIFNCIKDVELFKNGFEKLNSTKPLELIYCKYYCGDIRSDLYNAKYISYYGDIRKDNTPLYPLNSIQNIIGRNLISYQFDYRSKINSRFTVNNEEIRLTGRAVEYKNEYFEDKVHLENEELELVINDFFTLYKDYLKDFMTCWLNYINSIISKEELFEGIGKLDSSKLLKNYNIDYRTKNVQLAVQLNMLKTMKNEMDYVKEISKSEDESVVGVYYNLQSNNRKELLLLDCIMNLKRNYSTLYL